MDTKKRGVKLKYPFDAMKVNDTLEGGKHLVQCAINWARRNNKNWKFKSHKLSETTTQVTRIK